MLRVEPSSKPLFWRIQPTIKNLCQKYKCGRFVQFAESVEMLQMHGNDQRLWSSEMDIRSQISKQVLEECEIQRKKLQRVYDSFSLSFWYCFAHYIRTTIRVLLHVQSESTHIHGGNRSIWLDVSPLESPAWFCLVISTHERTVACTYLSRSTDAEDPISNG